MNVLWRYGILICNSLMIFGCFYFMEIPVGIQNEMIYNNDSFIEANITQNQTKCRVCLGLGEVRYNLMFSVTRWTTVAVSIPSGMIIDRIGSKRSTVLFSTLLFLGSVVFAVGATSQAPVSTPVYLLMLTGYACLAFGVASLRFVQTRVVSHYFPESTLTALGFGTLAYVGEGMSFYLTPFIATTIGVRTAVWFGPITCGIGFLFAIGLVFLLRVQEPTIITDKENQNVLSLNTLRGLPRTYWLFLVTVSFYAVCWIVKQANLPDYLELRHGFTMLEASHIVAISPIMYLLSPPLSVILKKIDCDGVIFAFLIVWRMVFYALLGFCPRVNIILISVADGLGLVLMTAMVWQFVVVLSPPAYVGTLGSLVFAMRSLVTASIFIAVGYILQKGKEITDTTKALQQYEYFFLILVILSLISTLFAVLMNVEDIRKNGGLNSRIRKWRQSNTETIALLPMDKLALE